MSLPIKILLTIAKLLALTFVAIMGLLQVPELRYDFGAKTPVAVEGPEELTATRFPRTIFASVRGTPEFDDAFVYRRYGLSYTYFTVAPYGTRLVVRTVASVTDDWRALNRFLGRLRPFEEQPFSYRIREIYRERIGADIPADAFFLALDDVPRPSGWQIGAVCLSSCLWLTMVWLFFFRRGKGHFSP